MNILSKKYTYEDFEIKIEERNDIFIIKGLSKSGKEKIKQNKGYLKIDLYYQMDYVKSLKNLVRKRCNETRTKKRKQSKIQEIMRKTTSNNSPKPSDQDSKISAQERKRQEKERIQKLKRRRKIQEKRNPKIFVIKKDAFKGLGIRQLEIGKGRYNFQTGCFEDNQIEYLDLRKITSIENLAGFKNNKIKAIKFCPQIINIESSCFENNEIKEINLEKIKTMWKIEENVFKNNKIEKLTLPSEITNIMPGAFENNFVEYIEIEEGQPINLTIYGSAFTNNNLGFFYDETEIEGKKQENILQKNQLKKIYELQDFKIEGNKIISLTEKGKEKLKENDYKLYLPNINIDSGKIVEIEILEKESLRGLNIKSINLGHIKEIKEGALAQNAITKIKGTKKLKYIHPWAFIENPITKIVLNKQAAWDITSFDGQVEIIKRGE